MAAITSSLSYSPSSFTLTKGTAMTAVTPTATGGPITGWSVSPSLPSGLSLDSSTGEISGTPDTVTSSAIYTVTASNTGGSTTADVTIVVNDVALSSCLQPELVHFDQGYGNDCCPPTATGGPITGWSVSPSLPSGLSLDSSTGEIAELQMLSHLLQFTPLQQQIQEVAPPLTSPFVVNDVAPSSLAYSPSSFL